MAVATGWRIFFFFFFFFSFLPVSSSWPKLAYAFLPMEMFFLRELETHVHLHVSSPSEGVTLDERDFYFSYKPDTVL